MALLYHIDLCFVKTNKNIFVIIVHNPNYTDGAKIKVWKIVLH